MTTPATRQAIRAEARDFAFEYNEDMPVHLPRSSVTYVWREDQAQIKLAGQMIFDRVIDIALAEANDNFRRGLINNNILRLDSHDALGLIMEAAQSDEIRQYLTLGRGDLDDVVGIDAAPIAGFLAAPSDERFHEKCGTFSARGADGSCLPCERERKHGAAGFDRSVAAHAAHDA